MIEALDINRDGRSAVAKAHEHARHPSADRPALKLGIFGRLRVAESLETAADHNVATQCDRSNLRRQRLRQFEQGNVEPRVVFGNGRRKRLVAHNHAHVPMPQHGRVEMSVTHTVEGCDSPLRGHSEPRAERVPAGVVKPAHRPKRSSHPTPTP